MMTTFAGHKIFKGTQQMPSAARQIEQQLHTRYKEIENISAPAERESALAAFRAQLRVNYNEGHPWKVLASTIDDQLFGVSILGGVLGAVAGVVAGILIAALLGSLGPIIGIFGGLLLGAGAGAALAHGVAVLGFSDKRAVRDEHGSYRHALALHKLNKKVDRSITRLSRTVARLTLPSRLNDRFAAAQKAHPVPQLQVQTEQNAATQNPQP